MKTLFTALLAATALCGSAATLDFSYNFAGAKAEGYGNNKAETYDVAVRLTNPSFTGATVSGLRVDLGEAGISAASGWLSSELKLKKQNGRNVNAPDIAVREASVSDGVLSVTFEQPYTIPAAGVYVGYSFTVDDVTGNGAPVSVAEGANPNGLYLHTSKTKLRWGAASEELNRVSTMTVLLDGNFPETAAYINATPANGAAGEPIAIAVTIENGGTAAISSIGYTYSSGDRSGTGTAEVSVPAGIARTASAELTLDPIAASGLYPVEFRVTSVNGNAADCAATQGKVEIYPFVPVNRPLMEEYTGLWCGWCPQGYVALEIMKQRKGDRFVAAAYHSGDEMEFPGRTPNSPNEYPAGYFNRSAKTSFHTIEPEWETACLPLPDGDVSASAEWADAEHTAVKATATARLIRDYSDADYRINFILIADGLSDPEWEQNNSYAMKDGEVSGDWPYMDNEIGRLFTHGRSHVRGLTFNDVAIASTDFDGVRGSVPASVTAGEEYTYSYTFPLEGIGSKLLTHPELLRVIAVLIDGKTGKVINSASSPYTSGEPFVGIENAEADGAAVEVARWSLDGVRLSAPARGINIVRYSDGTVRKVIVK